MSTLFATSRRVGKTIARTAVSSLSESTMRELRSALTEQLKNPEGPTQELATLLRKVANEARSRDIRPEQLIVIFKQLWNSLAESLRPQNSDQYERVRQRLVTLCIQAYYAE
jgi:hemoglobin-like flavoprotein